MGKSKSLNGLVCTKCGPLHGSQLLSDESKYMGLCKRCARNEKRKEITRALAKRTEKRCPQCGETKPRPAFYPSSGTSDGMAYYCKRCQGKRNAERRRAKILASLPERKARPRYIKTVSFGELREVSGAKFERLCNNVLRGAL